MIYESGVLTLDNADILAGGRLNAIPYNGRLTFELQVDVFDPAADVADFSIQLPNGDVPVDVQQIPSHPQAVKGSLDSDSLVRMSFPATQGGHFNFSVVLTGGPVCTYRVVLTP